MEIINQKTKKYNTMGVIEQVREMRYQEARELGLQEGLEEARREIVKNLLDQTEFSDDKIASLANVPLSFIEKVKQASNNN